VKKRKRSQQVLVIGLGRFGQSLARALVAGGLEVMAVDAREEATDEIANDVTHVMIADSTDEHVLREIGPETFDCVVCSIGGDIQASIMTTLLLKEMGVRRLIAKASTALHGRALQKLGVDRVVYPERDMAQRLAQDLITPELTEVLHLTVQESMFEIAAPRQFVGHNLVELRLRERFGLNVLAIRREGEPIVSPKPTEVILAGDMLLVLGNRERVLEVADE
jgi:trk system potassium uptake protein TrkA